MNMNRRAFLAALAGTAASAGMSVAGSGKGHAVHTAPLPTEVQKRWQDAEVGPVFHYDMPTFRPVHENNSRRTVLNPGTYNPEQLGTDQGIEAARKMGRSLRS